MHGSKNVKSPKLSVPAPKTCSSIYHLLYLIPLWEPTKAFSSHSKHRHSPMYAGDTFRKVWHKSNFGMVELITHMANHVCIYNEVQLITTTRKHWNLIGHNKRAQPSVSSFSSILPPSSSHCVFVPRKGGKNSVARLKINAVWLFTFLKVCVGLK
jgi:hypothetical protein